MSSVDLANLNERKIEMNKFVLLTTERSGSTFIQLWLNSHLNVRFHGEVFSRHYEAADGIRAYCESSRIRRLFNNSVGRGRFTKLLYSFIMNWFGKRFLKELFYNPTFSAPWTDMTTEAWKEYQPRENIDQANWVGIKIWYNQLLEYNFLQGWIVNQNVAIIHLIRENALKLLLSREMSKKTNEYQFGSEKIKPKLFLDPGKVIKQLDYIVALREKMKEKFTGNPYMEITYEQFFNNHSVESNRIYDFLKIGNAKTAHPKYLKKLNPDNLEEIIENYDSIAKVLKGTPYQKFLD